MPFQRQQELLQVELKKIRKAVNPNLGTYNPTHAGPYRLAITLASSAEHSIISESLSQIIDTSPIWKIGIANHHS